MTETVTETSCTVIPEGERLPEPVARRLASDYRYGSYRHWRGFGSGVPQRALEWQLRHDHEDPVRHWRLLLTGGDEVVGLAWVRSCPWESGQLGVSTATLHQLVVLAPTDAARREATQTLLQATRAHLQGSVQCLRHSLDVDDWVSIGALQAEGFFLTDTLVSFVCGREVLAHMQRRLRRRCMVRPVVSEDASDIETIARASRFGGRWYHDPRIPREAADRLYLEWVRQCYRKVFADDMVVGVRQGHAVGFLAYQIQRHLLAAAGIRLAGQGLLAVLPAHKGVALDVVQGGLAQGSQAVDFGQFDVHLDSVESLGLYGRMLRMTIAHIRHTFHCWLDTPGG